MRNVKKLQMQSPTFSQSSLLKGQSPNLALLSVWVCESATRSGLLLGPPAMLSGCRLRGFTGAMDLQSGTLRSCAKFASFLSGHNSGHNISTQIPTMFGLRLHEKVLCPFCVVWWLLTPELIGCFFFCVSTRDSGLFFSTTLAGHMGTRFCPPPPCKKNFVGMFNIPMSKIEKNGIGVPTH